MVTKFPICPQRIRKVPQQFSWVDHRLVRERYIESLSHQAAALYLFLVTVGDDKGLSYYSDQSISKRLSLDGYGLQKAREDLICKDLIAYKKPLYQVLSLDFAKRIDGQSTPESVNTEGKNVYTHQIQRKSSQLLSLGEILEQARRGGS